MATSGSFVTNGYDGRTLTFSWQLNSQNVSNNTSNITWRLTGSGVTGVYYLSGNFRVDVNGAARYASANRIELWNGTTVASGSLDIAHGSDGNKSFSAYAEAGIYNIAVNVSGSGSWALPQIARGASITGANHINDEQNPYMTHKNPAGFSTYAELEINPPSTHYAKRNNPGTSYTWALTDTERDQLRARIPNSNSGTIRYLLYSNSGQFSSYLDKTFTIVNANPLFSAFTYRDTNTKTVAITGNDQVLIKGLSVPRVTITSANKMTAQKQSTPKNYTITFDGKNVTANYTTTDLTIDCAPPTTAGTLNLNASAYDSRNNSTPVSQNVTVYDYDEPALNVSLERLNNYESQTTLKVEGNYSPLTIGGSNKNTIATNGVQYRLREVGGTFGSWTNLTRTLNTTNGTFTCNAVVLSLDNTKAFEVEVRAVDKLTTTTTSEQVAVGVPAFFISSNKKAIGVNCVIPDTAKEGDIYSNGLKVEVDKLVAEVITTASTAEILITGLDILSHGEIYDVDICGKLAATAAVYARFNNMSNANYDYQVLKTKGESSTDNSTPTFENFVRLNQTQAEILTGSANTTGFYGRLSISFHGFGSGGKINWQCSSTNVLTGVQRSGNIWGTFNTASIENITSLMIRTTSTFVAGTKIRVFRKR